jgi:hypothetical protein
MHLRGEILQTDDEPASPTFRVAASTATIRAIPNDCVAVLDIGASKSAVGLPAARRINAAAGRSMDLVRFNRHSFSVIRFLLRLVLALLKYLLLAVC